MEARESKHKSVTIYHTAQVRHKGVNPFTFPQSFPYDFMCLIWGNIIKIWYSIRPANSQGLVRERSSTDSQRQSGKEWHTHSIIWFNNLIGLWMLSAKLHKRLPHLHSWDVDILNTLYWPCSVVKMIENVKYYKLFDLLVKLLTTCLKFEITCEEFDFICKEFVDWVKKNERYSLHICILPTLTLPHLYMSCHHPCIASYSW